MTPENDITTNLHTKQWT